MTKGPFANRLGARVFGGTGDYLLFFNGFGTTQDAWRHQVAHFVRDRQGVVFDHVGSGASEIDHDTPTRYASLHDYIDDTLWLLNELSLTNVDMVGHSVGGSLAALTTIAAPGLCNRLVMIDAAPPRMTNLIDDFFSRA